MLPYFQEEVKSISNISILDIFSETASHSNFKIIERDLNSSTAVFQEVYSIKSIITCCIPGNSFQHSQISSIKIEILPDDSSNLIVIKALSGDPHLIKSFIHEFKTRIHQFMQSPQDNHYFFAKSFQSEASAYTNPAPIKKESQSISTNLFDFHKILASDEFEKKYHIDSFIENLKENISENVFNIIDSQIQVYITDFFIYYSEASNNSVYIRSLVEKNIFTKLYPSLLNFYKEKTKIIDGRFWELQQKLRNLSALDLLSLLQVSEKFRLVEKNDPYNEAKIVLNRLNRVKTPIEKINCLINTIACMKSCVVEYWKGNLEIQAMDDELPILMFLLIKSNVEFPLAELQVLKNYIGSRLENENRIILNFSSAVEYLALFFQY